MDDLSPIIDAIGVIADNVEKDKWKLCAAIADAFQEMPAYSRGLTSGLALRLKKSDDQIYCLRDAELLRASLRYDTGIPPSHFSTLSRLRDRYNLTDEDCINWLDWVTETGASVREMSQEITTKYTEDGKKAFFKRVMRVQKDVERLWEEAELVGLPDGLRVLTKAMLKNLKDFLDNLMEWKSTSA